MQEVIQKVKSVETTPVSITNDDGTYVGVVDIRTCVPLDVQTCVPLDVEVTNLPAVQAVSGAVSVNNLPVTQPVSGSVSVSNIPATQGVHIVDNPVPVLAVKDTGRQSVCLSWENISGATTEAVVNFTNGSRGGSALAGAASYTVSAGKTLRIQSLVFCIGQDGSPTGNSLLHLRRGTTASSPVLAAVSGGGPKNVCNEGALPIPDGLEVPAGQSICLSHVETATGVKFSCCLVGFEY
jgi:hypothetical protein